jgi:adenylosuccinate lyase
VAHEAIKTHSVAVALAMRESGGAGGAELVERLAADDRLGLSRPELEELLADRLAFTGAAGDQVARVVERVGKVVAAHPAAAAYSPGTIL